VLLHVCADMFVLLLFTVTVHTENGRVLSRIGSWGDGAYLFTNPVHVTVDKLTDNIYVSDPIQGTIKVQLFHSINEELTEH